MRLIVVLLSIMPVFGFSQQISFGIKTDTAGGVYFIRQLVNRNADTTLTTASAIRFEKAGDAINAINAVVSAIQRDSAEIQSMYRNTMRQLSELRESLSLLRPPAATDVSTPEQEIARLREENERLKKTVKKE